MIQRPISSLVLLFAIGIVSGARTASAVTVSSETGNGPSTFIESVSADGPISESAESGNFWDWSAAASFTRSNGADTASSTTAVSAPDETTDLGGGVNWTNADDLGIGGGLSWSTTPQEDLRTTGGSLEISKKLYFGGEDDESVGAESVGGDEAGASEPDFAPWLKLKVGVGARNYLQSFGKAGRRVLRPNVGTNELRQNSVTATARLAPFEAWRFELAVTRYRYDRDVKAFQQFLDSALALRRGFSALSNTVGGLAESSFTLGASVDFLGRFGFELSETHAVLAANQAVTLTTRALLSCDFGRFTGSIGAEGTNGGGTSEMLGIFGLAATF